MTREKEQKLRELLENLGKLVPTLLVVGMTADKHAALFMGSPEENDEKRRVDLCAAIAMMMEQRGVARNIILSSVCYFMLRHPEHQAQMYETLDMMKPVVSKKKAACPDCIVAQYPACDKNIPCCQCHDEFCNSRQPCPKKGGEE